MLERPARVPTDAEIAYCAGLFEGEGSILLSGGHNLNIRMTDAEPVKRVHEILGGSFGGPYKEPGAPDSYKPKFRWAAFAWRDIARIAPLLRPWLGPRRQAQIDRLMAACPVHPRGTRACPPEPIPSLLGYTRHRRLGEPACAVCLESNRLYEAAKRIRNAEAIRATNRTQYLKRKARQGQD